MTTSVKMVFHLEVTLADGRILYLPAHGYSTTVTGLGNDTYYKRVVVLTGNAQVVWDVTTDTANFAMFLLWADQDIEIQLTTDQAAAHGREDYPLKLRAGFPLLLSYDDSYGGYVVNWGGGVADPIDKVTINNQSGLTAVVNTYVIGE